MHIDIDLGATKAKLARTRRWNADRADAAEREYLRFLALIAENPGETIVPWGQDLDKLWHAHIQDTRQYAADCARLFGRFIHHDPHVESDPAAYERARARTAWLYANAFSSSDQRREKKRTWFEELIDAIGDILGNLADALGDLSGGHAGGESGGESSSSCGSSSCGGGGGGCGGGGCGGG